MDNSIRKSVQEEKGAECHFCGITEKQHKQEYDRGLDTHHKVPSRLGGSADMRNLIPLCRNCHAKLESITQDILPKGHSKEYNQVRKEDWEDFTAKSEHEAELAEAFKHLKQALKQRNGIEVHVVHEFKVVTSELRYVGTDEEKAIKKYQECENSATLETARVRGVTPAEIIDGKHVLSDMASDAVNDVKDELKVNNDD